MEKNRQKKVKERVVARYLRKSVRKIGGKCDKIKGEGANGIPDYLIAFGGLLFLVETKRPVGGKLSPIQTWQHQQYAKRKVKVWTLNTHIRIDRFINRLKKLV